MPYQFSDAILQTLDREVGGYYLSSDPYEQTIGSWKGIPVVYAKEHPDPKLFEKDREKALEKVKGKIVGEVVNAWVERTGHPRAMGQIGWDTQYPEVLKLKDEGKLSHSTSFFAMMKGKKLAGEVTPNHVLVFEETEKDLPKDSGAFILNKQEATPQIQSKEEKMPFAGFDDWESCMEKQLQDYDEETAKKVCGKLKAKYEGKNPTKEEFIAEMKEIRKEFPIRPSREDVKMPDDVVVKNKEEEQIAVLNKTISEKDAEIKALNQKIEKYEQEKRDAEWVSMKADLPVGMIHEPEKEAELRKEFDENPRAFAKRIVAMKKPEAPGKKEGAAVVAEQAELKKIEADWKSRGGF